jgi:diguanylate cyclase (GGDEF)-like protein
MTDGLKLRDRGRDDDGEATETAQPISTRATDAEKHPYLIVVTGAHVGELHKIEKARTVVGRADGSDIKLLDDGISRHHLEIVLEGERVIVRDLNSRNGSLCNGARIETAELAEGDKLSVGPTTILKFTYRDGVDEEYERRLYLAATRDGLTAALRREFFLDRLESEIAYSLRHSTPVALLLWDLDKFKAVNDRHGHQAGDLVLTATARTVAASIRREDIFGRYGGEEFALGCRGLTKDVAVRVAERLRGAIEQTAITFGGLSLQVTASFGVAISPGPGVGGTAELIAAADRAVYRAKDLGRNRVEVHGGR